VSAFGGIIALNRTLTADLAKKIIEVFSEVIIAPDVEAGALKVLEDKKNVRVLTTGGMPDISRTAPHGDMRGGWHAGPGYRYRGHHT
jgi:phosphoribosylaminoimidazolecarboxamide formyltransferase/IMP cyclohydrolase